MSENYPYPQAVFRHFAAISAIPHGSGATAQISRYCHDWAKAHDLDVSADELGNLCIKKPASAGYENRPRLILQGHLDMVCAKDPDCMKDMENDGLSLIFDDEYLSADGTTLGGDDGIAVAAALAILESDTIAHPPLTVILTVDEEIGMLGAASILPSWLDADYLLNLDSEEEGVFTVGCAGGVRVHMQVPVSHEMHEGTCFSISVSGLRGGHSGTEIHRQLMNANLALLRALQAIPTPIFLTKFSGGIRDNVIPTSAAAMFVAQTNFDTVKKAIMRAKSALQSEYPEETAFDITVENQGEKTCEAVQNTKQILDYLAQLPNGVMTMIDTLQMPETSLNLGIFDLRDDAFHVDALVRSCVNTKKTELADRLHQLTVNVGGITERSGDYPAWEYRPDTLLTRSALASYRRIFGTEPRVETIHAGLECGVLAAKSDFLTCISFGPDILDIHTPRERLSIPSTARFWQLLLDILANFPNT